MTMTCRVCANGVGNKTHIAREMMFGWRDEFAYMECAACGCLQNVAVPEDLARYYGASYYSVGENAPAYRPVYDRLKKLRTGAYLSRKGLIGGALLRKFGSPDLPAWVTRAGVRQDSRILEVGCGSGARLLSLRSEGFSQLAGADPSLEADIDYGRGLRISKAHVSEIKDRYEFIVLEDAFEHIPDPHATLAALSSLLEPNGVLIISIPLAGYAWQRYGVNWVQLDAPRHLYLHTEKSFRILANAMTVMDVQYDSGPVQFWGSEQYEKGIPLLDECSYRVNPDNGIFSAQHIAEFANKAQELNAQRLGDQATFYLRN